MRSGLVFAALTACSSSYEPPAPPPAEPSPIEQVRHYLATDPPDVFMVGAGLEDAGDAAPQAADALLAAWPKLETRELALAKRAGIERAQGKSRANCRECTIFGEAMDRVAPKDKRLATAWAALKPKLAAAEQAAYDLEAADKRPRVIVWADLRHDGNGEDMVVDCVVEALQKEYADFKWLTEWAPPERGTPSIQIVAAVATDEYVDSQTGKHAASLASGLKVGLVPSSLPPALAVHAFETSVSLRSPDEIRSDLGVRPTLEMSRTGIDQIHELRTRACAKIEGELNHQHAKH